MRTFPLLLALLLLAGCPNGSGTAPPDDDDDDNNPPPPPAKVASIRVLPDAGPVEVGDVRTLAEEFNWEGVLSVEWDFDYDGTTFTVDEARDWPTVPGRPLEVRFGHEGTQTLALRGIYPDNEVTALATLPITVGPRTTPDEFRDQQIDISETGFNEGLVTTPYDDVRSGNAALAINGDTLIAGYWARIGPATGYYTVVSTDGGNSWGPATLLSSDPLDQPYASVNPSISFAPLSLGFLGAWLDASGAVATGSIEVLPDERRAVVMQIPYASSGQRWTAPVLVPTDDAIYRVALVHGASDGTNHSCVIARHDTVLAPNGPWVQQSIPLTALPTVVSAAVSGNDLVVGVETLVEYGGGGAGSSPSITRRLQLLGLPVTGLDPPLSLQLTSASGSPTTVGPFGSAVALDANHWFCAFDSGNRVTVVYGGYGAALTIEQPVTLIDRPTIGNLACAALDDGFLLLYTVDGVPPPELHSGRTEQLYASRWPSQPGAARVMDLKVNTDDPDVNEGHVFPSVVADQNGVAYATWVGSQFNRHALGRFSFNRTD